MHEIMRFCHVPAGTLPLPAFNLPFCGQANSSSLPQNLILYHVFIVYLFTSLASQDFSLASMGTKLLPDLGS